MEEHRTLKQFRERWLGKIVAYWSYRGTVIGVGDDGYRCDYDRRRRAKPTGQLFVRRDRRPCDPEPSVVDEPFDSECVVVHAKPAAVWHRVLKYMN
jgi:hypothetical protein